MRFRWVLMLISFSFLSCVDGNKQKNAKFVEEWSGKMVSFPSDLKFFSYDEEVTSLLQNKWDYAVLSYTDSMGCTSCKLQLNRWRSFINETDTLLEKRIAYLFIIHPFERKELIQLLKEYKFDYPVCIDEENVFNKQNHLPENDVFQTFLLDENNKVLAIGNPVLNPAVKELYLKIIQGKTLQDESEDKLIMTTVSLESTVLSMGDFSWQEERRVHSG